MRRTRVGGGAWAELAAGAAGAPAGPLHAPSTLTRNSSQPACRSIPHLPGAAPALGGGGQAAERAHVHLDALAEEQLDGDPRHHLEDSEVVLGIGSHVHIAARSIGGLAIGELSFWEARSQRR